MMRMEPYDVYKYYMAMKLHFESDSYEAPKYNYKTSAKPQAFFKRRDKYHFAKLGRKFNEPTELIDFLTSQFIESDSKNWIGDMLQNEERYTDWQKRIQSLSYIFEQDINRLAEDVESFDQVFETPPEYQYPRVIQRYLQNEITLESVVILDRLTGFLAKADRQITETIVWPDVSKRIRKYGLLLRFDENRMRKIILRIFTS